MLKVEVRATKAEIVRLLQLRRDHFPTAEIRIDRHRRQNPYNPVVDAKIYLDSDHGPKAVVVIEAEMLEPLADMLDCSPFYEAVIAKIKGNLDEIDVQEREDARAGRYEDW